VAGVWLMVRIWLALDVVPIPVLVFSIMTLSLLLL
jgi:hypothetical protein